MQMATEEMAMYFGKPKNSIDALDLKGFLIVIIIHAFEQLEKENKPFNFLVRMLMMEHFTVNVFGWNEEYYSFVAFKDAEQSIDNY